MYHPLEELLHCISRIYVKHIIVFRTHCIPTLHGPGNPQLHTLPKKEAENPRIVQDVTEPFQDSNAYGFLSVAIPRQSTIDRKGSDLILHDQM